jgi:hypothetical protein
MTQGQDALRDERRARNQITLSALFDLRKSENFEEKAIHMMIQHDHVGIAAEFSERIAFVGAKDAIQSLLPQPIHEEIVPHLTGIKYMLETPLL